MGRRAESAASTEHLDDALLARLQASRAYPSVSVLLTTAPHSMLASRDVALLDRLIDTARRRLTVELRANHVDAMVERLHRLATRAQHQPPKRAIALFASDQETALVQLPIAVADRVVVDPTFATRDLVRALALQPRIRLLVVSERNARVIEGWPGQLRDISDRALPVPTDRSVDRPDRARPLGRHHKNERHTVAAAHFRGIAETLGRRHRIRPLPLIVVGVARHHAFWQKHPELGPAVIGTIAGNHDRTPLGRLDRLARPIVDEHVRASRRVVLGRLAAEPPSRCAGGIHDVWAAAAGQRIELLCVEDSYVFPARPLDSGRRLEPAKDVEHPEVLDDAIDELIEMVALAGGETVVVHDGALDGCDHVAAVLRTC